MAEARRPSRWKRSKEGGVFGQVGVEHLQGHHLPRAGVPGPVHGGLAARGNLLKDLVSAYLPLHHGPSCLSCSSGRIGYVQANGRDFSKS